MSGSKIKFHALTLIPRQVANRGAIIPDWVVVILYVSYVLSQSRQDSRTEDSFPNPTQGEEKRYRRPVILIKYFTNSCLQGHAL